MTKDQTPHVKTVGRYQILEELGRGAMAVVYKGKDPVIGRTVALKTLLFREDSKEMRDLRQALYRDACAAGTLAHPNIVTIYDVIEEAGMTAVAMEFIEGRTLDALIKEQAPLPIEMAFGLFDQIVAGLDYAHTKGIIHRDVKPANIMLTTDGRVKVTDFGVARVTSAGVMMTATVVGSPSYMSPEQIKGGTIDGRSDLFSATTVLYEMLTKARPFRGDDIATTLYRIVHELPTPPTEFNPAIGPELTRVFEHAMAKDPNDRYLNGAELAQAMRQAGGFPSATMATGPAPVDATINMTADAVAARTAIRPPARPVRPAAARPVAVETPAPAKGSGKTIALVGAVAALLLLGVGAYWYMLPGPGRPAGGSASAPLQSASETPSVENTTPPPADFASTPVVAAPDATTSAVPVPAVALSVVTNPAPEPLAVVNPAPVDVAAPTQKAAPVEAPVAAAPAPSAAPAAPAPDPPPAPAPAAPPRKRPAPPVATVSVSFDVRGDFYSGMQVTVDGKRVQGDWPVTDRLRVGTHAVTYSWTSGPRQGTSITETVTLTTGSRNGYRIVADPADSSVRAVALN
ncbi:MAG: protein kinase [Vicinamibacterales bacterium]